MIEMAWNHVVQTVHWSQYINYDLDDVVMLYKCCEIAVSDVVGLMWFIQTQLTESINKKRLVNSSTGDITVVGLQLLSLPHHRCSRSCST